MNNINSINDKNKSNLVLKDKNYSLDIDNLSNKDILERDLLHNKNIYKNSEKLELNSELESFSNNDKNDIINKTNFIKEIKNNLIEDRINDIVCNFKNYNLKKIRNLLNDNNKIIKYGDLFTCIYN